MYKPYVKYSKNSFQETNKNFLNEPAPAVTQVFPLLRCTETTWFMRSHPQRFKKDPLPHTHMGLRIQYIRNHSKHKENEKHSILLVFIYLEKNHNHHASNTVVTEPTMNTMKQHKQGKHKSSASNNTENKVNFPCTCMIFPFHPSNKQQEKQKKKTRLASPTWTWFFTKRFFCSLLLHSPFFSNSPLPLIFSHILETLKMLHLFSKNLIFLSIINIFNLFY